MITVNQYRGIEVGSGDKVLDVTVIQVERLPEMSGLVISGGANISQHQAGVRHQFGGVIGGILIGISEQFAGLYLPAGFADIVAYLILLVMLIIRPQGLFATMMKKKV